MINPTSNSVVWWRWDVTPKAFGDNDVDNNPDGNALIYNLALRYPGQYFDGLAWINYNYYRDYDATAGRFLEGDPEGVAAGPSLYGYVGDNPMKSIDPLGLFPWEHVGGATPPTGGEGGYVAYFGGMAIPVVTVGRGNCLWLCIMIHEAIHASQVNQMIGDWSRTGISPGQAIGWQDLFEEGRKIHWSGELRAHLASNKCYRELIRKPPCKECIPAWEKELAAKEGLVQMLIEQGYRSDYMGESTATGRALWEKP